MINVYNSTCEKVIGKVKYNENLDYWDGNNMTNGGTGMHKGLTKLKDGRYVLIHGTQWQGAESWAEVISKEQALQEIVKSRNDGLLENPKFAELKALKDKVFVSED